MKNLILDNKEFLTVFGPYSITLGAIITIYINSRIARLNRQHDVELENQKLLTLKFEEFSLHLKDNYNWSINLLNETSYILGSDEHTTPKTSEIHSATTLAILYFPQFEEKLRNLYDHQHKLYEIAYTHLSRKLAIRNNREFEDYPPDDKYEFEFEHNKYTVNQFKNEFIPIQEEELNLLEDIIAQIKLEAPKYRYRTKPNNGKL